MKRAHALPALPVKVLSQSLQPIFLAGPSRQARRSVANAIHREMLGFDLDFQAPHPDASILVPPPREDGNLGRSIGIDLIKEFVDRLCLTPYQESVRFGFIEPASALTVESQNALLRYVEEPTKSSRIILSSRRSDDLIPTLLSRFQVVRLPGRSGGDGESAVMADRYNESESVVDSLYDRLDDPDAVERLLEYRLAKPSLEIYNAVSEGRVPDPKWTDAFMEKRIPASDSSILFVETVFSAVCSRLAGTHPPGSADGPPRRILDLAGRLLVLQTELRYNPYKLAVLSAVGEWLEGSNR